MASSGLTCVSLPEMPAAMVGEVSSAIQSVRSSIAGELSGIREAAVELTRRALWAEIADKLASGTDLSDSQLREFNAWLMDGSMLRYANSYQAGLAGDFVGAAYRDTFRNPEDLIELAQILRGSQQNSAGEALEAFSASFVESFGADNMSAVPRVIQAMEWSHVINNSFSDPGSAGAHRRRPRLRGQGARTRSGRGSAGAVLARARECHLQRPAFTDDRGGDRARRRHVGNGAAPAHGPLRDPLPARLLRQGCRREDLRRLPLQPDGARAAARRLPTHSAVLAGRRPRGLPYDTKVLVLDALARNPDAAPRRPRRPT